MNIYTNYFSRKIISNRDLFKLILHLAHAANDCDRQKYKEGQDIGNLASLLCSNLSTIPDYDKFISSLYHIIRCLLQMNLYEEAKNLILYITRDNLEYTKDKINTIIQQLTYLWHKSAEKELLGLKQEPNDKKHYDRYKNAIKYELLLTKKSYKNHGRHVIVKLCIYLKKLTTIKNMPNEYINDFMKYVINEHYEHMSIDKNDKLNDNFSHKIKKMTKVIISEYSRIMYD